MFIFSNAYLTDLVIPGSDYDVFDPNGNKFPNGPFDDWERFKHYEALRDFPGTIIAISHDRYFINRFAEKVCVLENGGIEYASARLDSFIEEAISALDAFTASAAVLSIAIT